MHKSSLVIVIFVYGPSSIPSFRQSFTLKAHFLQKAHPRLFPTALKSAWPQVWCHCTGGRISSGNPLNQPGWVSSRVIYVVTRDISFMSADGLVSEGEFLDITEIKRQQAEDYECITNNGVAPPDQRKVKVTVNCKYSLPRAAKQPGANISTRTGPPLL